MVRYQQPVASLFSREAAPDRGLKVTLPPACPPLKEGYVPHCGPVLLPHTWLVASGEIPIRKLYGAGIAEVREMDLKVDNGL